ncbi:MAG TPA: hypothetical protein PKX08_18315, partial [Cyclobacteriaceae bacterium]|nr:hypothetical protein [Cyclobacteriaceae bacterium]
IQTLNGSTAIKNTDYGFNLNNELESIIDNKVNSRSQTFAYDAAGRLNDAQGQYGSLNFTYDLVGNRTSQTRTGAPDGKNFVETYTLPSISHKLSDISATGTGGQNRSFGYSPTGNVTSDGKFTYEYGARNRLNNVKSGSNVVVENTYDSFGQRVIKKAGSESTHFIYSLSSELLAEMKNDGTPIRDYVYLGDRVLAMIDLAK